MSLSGFSRIGQWLAQEKPIGVFADTTILFSATYTPDRFNEESEIVFTELTRASVPVFVSVNVRAEFLENHRRVSIADCLVDFLNDAQADLDGPLLLKLQSHKKSHKQKSDEGKNTRLDVNQIKVFRSLLSGYSLGKRNGWQLLCQEYLKPQISSEWSNVERELSLNFISTRSEDRSPMLAELPQWERVVELIGDYGIGSADAMILNIFLCSKIPALLTADMELAESAVTEAKGQKQIFVPDSLLASQM